MSDWSKVIECGSCGKGNPHDVEVCLSCGASIDSGGDSVPISESDKDPGDNEPHDSLMDAAKKADRTYVHALKVGELSQMLNAGQIDQAEFIKRLRALRGS